MSKFDEWHDTYFNMEVFDGEYVHDDLEAAFSSQQKKIDELEAKLSKLEYASRPFCTNKTLFGINLSEARKDCVKTIKELGEK